MGAETIHWPDHHSCHIHHCCQNVIHDHQLVKGEWEKRGQLSEGEQDYEDGKDEAQGVHGHAPLHSWGDGVLAHLQGREDETGEEGLQHLHYAGQRGEEPAVLPTRTKASQGHFACVHSETHPGHHGGADLAVADLAGEKGGVDDGDGEAHEARQHSEGSGEVIPGERQFGVGGCELQDENEKGEEEAEAPGEHAPRPVGRCAMSHCCHQAKTHTSEGGHHYSHDAHRLGK